MEQSVNWYVAVIDTIDASHVATSSDCEASAAEAVALRKESVYHTFLLQLPLPTVLPFETLVLLMAMVFSLQVGRKIFAFTDDPRETPFMFQSLSIAV